MEHRCAGVIPGTFIMCGEGGNYCSDECRLAAEEGRPRYPLTEEPDGVHLHDRTDVEEGGRDN